MPPSTPRSSACATAPRQPSSSGGTSSWWRRCPASTAWGIPSTTPTWSSPCGRGRSTHGISCCGSWWRSATTATTWPSSAICSGSGGTRWRFTRCTPTATPSGGSSLGTRSTASRRSTPSPVRPSGCCSTWPFTPPATTSPPRRRWSGRCRRSSGSWRSARPTSRITASSLRPSASTSVPATTWR